jgi:adenosyl cobinamide kinase/adenosyl cobinamide phosphate guanylyltransferase
MASISEIRESIDVRLDKVQARAEAFDAALEATKDQIDERIARHKEQAQQSLGKLASEIDAQKDLPETRKQALHSVVDNLDEQIGMAQSASRETLESARRQIQDGMRKIETELEAAVSDARPTSVDLLHASMAAYARAVDRLDAELEAAQHRFASTRSQFDATVKAGRQEVAQEIAKLKQRLGEKATYAGEHLVLFERELGDGMERVAKAFKDLFA